MREMQVHCFAKTEVDPRNGGRLSSHFPWAYVPAIPKRRVGAVCRLGRSEWGTSALESQAWLKLLVSLPTAIG